MRKQNWYKLEQKAKKDLGLSKWKIGQTVTYTDRNGHTRSVKYLNTLDKNFLDSSHSNKVRDEVNHALCYCPSDYAFVGVDRKGCATYTKAVAKNHNKIVYTISAYV